MQSVFSGFVFIQYLDIVDHSSLPIDNIDKKLNCIRLKWSRVNDKLQKNMDSGKEYGLCPISSILGITHLDPMKHLLCLLNSHSDYKQSALKNIGPPTARMGTSFTLTGSTKSSVMISISDVIAFIQRILFSFLLPCFLHYFLLYTPCDVLSTI